MNERYVAKMSEVVKLCKETAALRRQVEELRQTAAEAGKNIENMAQENAELRQALDKLATAVVVARLTTLVPQDMRNGAVQSELFELDEQARAALARYGGGGEEMTE